MVGRSAGWRGAAMGAAVLLVLGVVGCAGPAGGGLGELALTVTAPAGVDASVEVTGPGGDAQTVSTTQTLGGLAPGTYHVTAAPARRPGTLVDDLFDAAVSDGGTVEVSAGATATATVSYQHRPGTGALWVAVYGSTKLIAFDDGQLPNGGAGVTPSLALGLGSGIRPYSVAFDAEGNAWAGTQDGELLEFAVDDLASSGTPDPAVVLDSGGTDVNGIVFGADGMLWAAVSGAIVGFTPSQRTASGSPTPDVTLTGSASHPVGAAHQLAFDASGGLWLANLGGAVLRFSPSQLATGGALEPDVVLESNGTSLNNPRGVAFDASGSLWVACWSGNAVEKFRPQDIAVSGTPDPFVRLTGVGVNPLRLAFDNAGNLWLSSNYDPTFSHGGHVGMIAAADLVASGTPPLGASFTSVGGFDSGGTLAFAPMPAWSLGAP